MSKVNKVERIKMVKAMEYIAHQINDEDIFMEWLMNGVADGDIDYGDTSESNVNNVLDYYIEDDNFAYLMELFLSMMRAAKKSGGLYCDDVVSSYNEIN